jgi:hypothetical protein
MQRWKPILAPVLFFLIGMIAGGTVVSLVVARRVKHLIQSGPAETVALAGQAVARRLDLDATQRRALEPILADVATGFVRIRVETLPEVRHLILDAEARLRPQLRPDQQTKLDELLLVPRARWNALIPDVPADKNQPGSGSAATPFPASETK